MLTDIDSYLQIAVPLIISTIKELKFNKRECRFDSHSSGVGADVWVDLFSSSPHIKLDIDSCCVCMENINGRFKTKCGHSLCIPCWDGLHEVEDGGGDTEVPCPICRGDITTYAEEGEEQEHD
jgi:hypothetical protein